jgi:hypothetical protein
MQNRAPVYVINKDAKREQGKNAQAANIKAAKVNQLKLTFIMIIYRLSPTS